MTSLIDVVLILVVFFVISTSFVREARLNVAAGRSTRLFAAGSREAVMPDLALVYKGHNTDIGITSPDETFGSDLDFARAWSWEGGVEHQVGAHARLRLIGFSRTASGIPAASRK